MRILYVDVDSLRPDHLGCYGYHRKTSPRLDRLAQESALFTNVYASDTPCLPSRTALWSGRFGFRTGVVTHDGTPANPFLDGPRRATRDSFFNSSWMTALRKIGLYTATISPFAERHAAWHWLAGFNEMINPGQMGMERADDIWPLVDDWLERRGQDEDWFLHINLWDPHTPYRTPEEYGNPFVDSALDGWFTEALRKEQWMSHGPHGAQEPNGWGDEDDHERYPTRIPNQIDSMEAAKLWIDSYDTGVHYADRMIEQVLDKLDQMGIYDDTVIMVSADHGENLGELNVWGDHQTADQMTCRVPLIVRWPGVTDEGWADHGLHYQFDWAATLIEMLGGAVPENWDGHSFAEAFRASEADPGRDFLVLGHGLWAVQRAVRFEDYICIRTYHAGYKPYPPVMLFDLKHDRHEQHNLAGERGDLVNWAMRQLTDWQSEMMQRSLSDVDPLMTVMREGGPPLCRDRSSYLDRLRATGRAHHAEMLLRQHPDELRASSA
ncbi:MAG: sulfatase [Chloroflexi bacterium]|nr:sulfatase [Chloroflexota bacterium]